MLILSPWRGPGNEETAAGTGQCGRPISDHFRFRDHSPQIMPSAGAVSLVPGHGGSGPPRALLRAPLLDREGHMSGYATYQDLVSGEDIGTAPDEDCFSAS